MELEELTAYARERYGMNEERRWEDFPGFSVLRDPRTGKWAALLMRQWDSDSGREIQRCDVHCPPGPGDRAPFRMKGALWTGVIPEEESDPGRVFRLLDRAMAPTAAAAIPLELRPAAPNAPNAQVFRASALPRGGGTGVPGKIWDMMKLYRFGDGSFREKCLNFVKQGEFMADFEDDAPWYGEFHRYFPTYHDLNPAQLRGYFTWRAGVRRGDYQPVALSLAYLYLYELLQGIGCASPRESLERMEEFEKKFVDAGLGSPGMGRNLRRWMLEFALLRGLPPEELRRAAGDQLLGRERALAALRHPEEAEDRDVAEGLLLLGGGKLGASPVMTRDQDRGRRMLARIWRAGCRQFAGRGDDLFTACFGTPKSFPFTPLGNTVHWEERPAPDGEAELGELHRFRCVGGQWTEMRLEGLYFDRPRLEGLLHTADRLLRRAWKTGRYLKEKPGEAWAVPVVEEALREEELARREAARPKITLDLGGLESIRREAEATRDSLLTPEELAESALPPEERAPAPAEGPAKAAEEAAKEAPALPGVPYGEILAAVVRGEDPTPLLAPQRLLPSVVADEINQALFEEFGDSVLDWDGTALTLVEDYREELEQRLGGTA